MFTAYSSSYCSLADNAALHFLQDTVRATPLALWVALSGFAYVTHEWYFFVYTHTYIAVYMAQAWLGHLVGWLRDPIDPSCNSQQWVGPSIEAALIGAFVTQAVINAAALRLPISWPRVVWKCVLIAAVVVVPSINHNTSWTQAFAGLGLGVVIGIVAMWLLWNVWMPLFPALDKMWLCEHYIQLHSCRDLRELYYRDIVDDSTSHHQWGVRQRYGVSGHRAASFLLLV